MADSVGLRLSRRIAIIFASEILAYNILEIFLVHHGARAGALGLLLQIRAKTVQIKIATLYLGAILETLPGWVLAIL